MATVAFLAQAVAQELKENGIDSLCYEDLLNRNDFGWDFDDGSPLIFLCEEDVQAVWQQALALASGLRPEEEA